MQQMRYVFSVKAGSALYVHALGGVGTCIVNHARILFLFTMNISFLSIAVADLKFSMIAITSIRLNIV